MNDSLDDILQQEARAPRLGALQLARLRQVTGRSSIVCWDGISAVAQPGVAVLVLDATHATRIEALIEALHESAIVIVPFAESPAFDHLKTRLHAHGSLGAEGADAPHQVWWGGPRPFTAPTGLYHKQGTLFISSWDSTTDAEIATGITSDLQHFGLDHIVRAIPPGSQSVKAGTSKVDFIIEQWTRACRPVLWIDPQARISGHPLLPQALECDFAVQRRVNGTMITGALFFHQTERAQVLLDIWRRLTCSHPNLPEAFLLDQAWTLTNAQRQIETTWLPETYWQTDDTKPRNGTIILGHHNAADNDHPLAPFAIPLQSGRRYGRPQSPEAHLVMTGASGGRGLITVLIRDVLAASARDVGAAVEAAAAAFTADCGGFSQMEIVLCAWNEDVEAVLQIEDHSWVLMTDASERLRPDSFRALKQRHPKPDASRVDEYERGDTTENNAVVSLIDSSLGARMKRSGVFGHAFLRRPDRSIGSS